MEKRIYTPLIDEKVRELKSGDSVLLSGVIYTARDAAHKRLVELINSGKELPLDIKNETIYYVGPTPARPGQVIGSAGPTTSYRMDPYAPLLLDKGLRGMIGKGARCEAVVDSIIRNKCVYFASIGGAAALTSKCIVTSELIAYDDLGAEAIRRLEVKDLPLVVVIDSEGNNLYEIGQKQYLSTVVNE